MNPLKNNDFNIVRMNPIKNNDFNVIKMNLVSFKSDLPQLKPPRFNTAYAMIRLWKWTKCY